MTTKVVLALSILVSGTAYAEADLAKIVAKYQLSAGDLIDVFEDAQCDGTSLDNSSHKAIKGQTKSKIVTKDFKIPSGAYVSFCDGYLDRITAGKTQEIKMWTVNCVAEIKSTTIEDLKSGNETYRCKLNVARQVDGLTIPANTTVIFNKEKILCFGPDRDDDRPVSINGVKIDGKYKVVKGQLVKASPCY